MDKNAIKKYAVWARNELIARVSQRAQRYGITKEQIVAEGADSINGKILTNTEKRQRQALIQKIKNEGFEQVMEEVAYTWFNRFSALRFMEVNGYLPSHVRVFTDQNNAFKPEIMAEAIHLDLAGLDMEKVYAYKEANNDDELFKYLIITQCNDLSKILPGMFQKIADYTELLFPDNLLREGSVIEQMITMIAEDDWNVSDGGQVEIIGWLYQYYNDEKKNQVINIYKGAVKREDIPAATQLFTTDWVVRYIIDNSVGRYWIERHPNSGLKDDLEYLVVPPDSKIPEIKEDIKPQSLSVLDPCVGSGHFIVYAFEVLMKIYKEYGYSERDAAVEIVNNNIYGIDIDDRAIQLAYFAVMMKGRQYDRRFFNKNPKPNIYAVEESNNIDADVINYFVNGDPIIKKNVTALIATFKDAKEYGSIIQMPNIAFEILDKRIDEINKDINFLRESTLSELIPIISVGEILSRKYAVVATNPPYLSRMDGKLKNYVAKNYKDYSGDLFSVFIYRNFELCLTGGYSGFMAPYVWMFILTYAKLREFIIRNKEITTLIQMEYSAFEQATVPICSFVLCNNTSRAQGSYYKLSEFKGGMEVQKQKVLESIAKNNVCDYFYMADQKEYLNIPCSPIAYWAGEKTIEAFKSKLLGDYGYPKQGFATGNNNIFLRLWQEVDFNKIGFGIENRDQGIESGKKWFPCNKGGGFRRWYGNNSYLANWENDGKAMIAFSGSVIRNPQFYFKKGITWSSLTSGKLSMRYSPTGFLFESKGSVCFLKNNENLPYILGLMNTDIVANLLLILSPTLDYHEGPISRVPVIIDKKYFSEVTALVEENIEIAKKDWDSFENSWDFKKHPLIRKTDSIEEAYCQWEKETDMSFAKLKSNEERLNEIFIDVYGLQNEVSKTVEDKDVSIRKADRNRDVKSFISYAVGCMFGRYSLDREGLVYAGGNWDQSLYSTYAADNDGIIPICDDEYFSDDIVGRFVNFVKTVYGTKKLEENLRFISESLGSSGTPRDVIRDYFINGFYADHCSMCSVPSSGKRPIYWMFDSGKRNGFKCLIYMHRYQADTIARIRTDYVHEQQSRYRTAISELESRINSASTSERVTLNKKLKHLQEQSAEIHNYEEKVHHIADKYISIDLDDGVKENYAKFQTILATIK